MPASAAAATVPPSPLAVRGPGHVEGIADRHTDEAEVAPQQAFEDRSRHSRRHGDTVGERRHGKVARHDRQRSGRNARHERWQLGGSHLGEVVPDDGQRPMRVGGRGPVAGKVLERRGNPRLLEAGRHRRRKPGHQGRVVAERARSQGRRRGTVENVADGREVERPAERGHFRADRYPGPARKLL